MNLKPAFLRYPPFGLVFTLSEDEDLMCCRLRKDFTYSESLSDYQCVELTEAWSDSEQDTLLYIHQTLLGDC